MAVHGRNAHEQEIIERTTEAGQGHVFEYWQELSQSSRRSLLSQLADADFTLLAELHKKYIRLENSHKLPGSFEPAEFHRIPQSSKEIEAQSRARRIGEGVLREGRVAAFLVAGGQGSRLRFRGPKGAFPISSIKKKSLFQLHAEKIISLSRKYETTIPWFIMTSQSNHNETIEFFKRHAYFGLGAEKVQFFSQDMVPALDDEGRLILDAKDHIFTNPNGHGGSLTALKKSGALTEMRRLRIDIIFYFQVDNVLVNMCDPLFIGQHSLKQAEMSAKVTAKREPAEKLGVLGRIDGQLGVIEYSDLPDREKQARNPDGTLKFGAGNLAIHLFNVDFVERLNQKGLQLPWHVAHKRIPFLRQGALVEPDRPNGYKFETFVFDALREAKTSSIIEVKRKEEFSPVKNLKGMDSPATARQDMTNLFGSWLLSAGVAIPGDTNGNVAGDLEISPLFALDETELREKIDRNLEFKASLYLG